MKKREKEITKKTIIQYVLIFSVVLYIAGIYTGININKILNIGIENSISNVKNFLDKSSVDIKNNQLKDYYTGNFAYKKCRFQKIQIDQLKQGLPNFWFRLPERLESYEATGKQTEEYKSIKREYFRYSLRLWLLSTNYMRNCNDSSTKALLYFYKTNCSSCLKFVKKIEELKNSSKGYGILILPIEGGFPDDTITALERLYNITTYPTVIYNYKTYKKAEELISVLENSKKEDSKKT